MKWIVQPGDKLSPFSEFFATLESDSNISIVTTSITPRQCNLLPFCFWAYNQSRQLPEMTSATATSTKPVIVVGSMVAAQDGSYQKVVENESAGGAKQVEMYMSDRITDGGESCDD